MIGPKLGEGREAEVYTGGSHAVVKLYRPGYLGHRAEAVAAAATPRRDDVHAVTP